MKYAEPPQVGETQRLLERIATLERERDVLREQRDEARALFLSLSDRAVTFFCSIEIRPEWRKGGER